MAKSALHRLKRKIPYAWDLNIYRGCQHACRYCYALNTHPYPTSGKANITSGSSAELCVKVNIAERLEQELRAPGWRGEVINIGGVTDSYQPAEEEYKLMPEILRLLIKYKTPAIISTKSELVLRDFDLIDRLSRITYINVAASVTTMDEGLRRRVEPGASPAHKRLEMLSAFKNTRASTGLHLMPVLPLLGDGESDLEAIMAAAARARVDYVLPGVLYLRGKTRSSFFAFLEEEFPQHCADYRLLYQGGGADKAYKDNLYRGLINPLREEYRLSSSYMKPLRAKLPATNDMIKP